MVDHDKILRLRPQFTAYAYSLCGDACDGDDLVQEAIVRALEKAREKLAEVDRRLAAFGENVERLGDTRTR